MPLALRPHTSQSVAYHLLIHPEVAAFGFPITFITTLYEWAGEDSESHSDDEREEGIDTANTQLQTWSLLALMDDIDEE